MSADLIEMLPCTKRHSRVYDVNLQCIVQICQSVFIELVYVKLTGKMFYTNLEIGLQVGLMDIVENVDKLMNNIEKRIQER